MAKTLRGAWLFVLLFLVTSCSPSNQTLKAPQAVDGVLKLQDWNFAQNGMLDLSGNWGFYWRELLRPNQITPELKPQFVSVPNSWTSYKINGQALPPKGYATFRLEVQLPYTSQPYGLYIDGEGTAYTLWVDGRLAAQNGQVGTTAQGMIPKSKPQSVFFQPSGDTTELVIQISNFQHRKAGFRNAITIGLASQINSHRQNAMSWDAFIMGIYLVMALYHAFIYGFRPSNKSPLYFSLACLIAFTRKGLLDQKLLVLLLPGMSWELALQIEYLTFYFTAPLFGVFLQSLYPKDFHTRVIRTMLGLAAAFSIAMLFIDTLTLSNTISLYQGITLVEIVYLAFRVARIIIKKGEDVIYIAIASLILLAGVVLEILSLQNIIPTNINGTATFLGFVMMQAILLSSRLSKSFRRVEVLSNELEEINAILSASERKYRGIFEESKDMIFIAQLDEQIKEANPTSLEILGYSMAELQNMKLSDLVVNPADNSRIRRLLRKQPFVKNYEFALRRKDGGIIDGLLTLTFRKDETGEISELQGNVHDISARKQAEAAHMRALEFRQLSITDPLTKIYNRRFFDEIAVKEFERARRSGSPLTIVLFDIDHFKKVNDTYGHLTGDQVLINLANLCQAKLRSMDIFARYGGEEFIILMPDADHNSAHQSIERLRASVAEKPLATDESTAVSVTLSAGIAAWNKNNPANIRELVKRADQALYQSKENGRNRITIWEQELLP